VCHNEINLKNHNAKQIKFYTVMAVTAGFYGSETWVLTEISKNRIQAP
jgi:hypothetical protein